jgi:hypothetical protein
LQQIIRTPIKKQKKAAESKTLGRLVVKETVSPFYFKKKGGFNLPILKGKGNF